MRRPTTLPSWKWRWEFHLCQTFKKRNVSVALPPPFLKWTPEHRGTLLLRYAPALPLVRQMVTRADIAKFAPLVAIAGHGHSHGPLTHLRRPQADLENSAQQLKLHNADFWAMSFPHGAHNHKIDSLACQQGFEVCYTSEAHLVDTGKNTLGTTLLGRIHIPENQWTCEGNSISNARLAFFLFFRSIRG